MDNENINLTEQIHVTEMRRVFDDRQLRLIHNCRVYAYHDPAGLPGHNLMLIVDQLVDLLAYSYGEAIESV